MDSVYYVLAVMTVLFPLWLVLRNIIYNSFNFRICAICATIVSTWAGLLALKLMGYSINELVIAILMGQSVTGFMYFLGKGAEATKNRTLSLMKPLVILVGTLIVYYILGGGYL